MTLIPMTQNSGIIKIKIRSLLARYAIIITTYLFLIFTKGASRVMFHYGGSISKALVDLFPDIGLQKNKLANLHSGRNSGLVNYTNTITTAGAEQTCTPIRRNFFNNKFRRKQLFEQYAAENGFDPFIPANWYNQSRRKVMAHQVLVLTWFLRRMLKSELNRVLQLLYHISITV